MQVRKIEIIQKTNQESLEQFLVRVNKRITDAQETTINGEYGVVDIRQTIPDNANFREVMLIMGHK